MLDNFGDELKYGTAREKFNGFTLKENIFAKDYQTTFYLVNFKVIYDQHESHKSSYSFFSLFNKYLICFTPYQISIMLYDTI